MQFSCFRTSQLQILYCYNCSILHSRDLPEWSIVKSEVQNLVHNIRPFNLHPDFKNQGLFQTLEKCLHILIFFSGLAPWFFQVLASQGGNLEKIKVCRTWNIFLGFEKDCDFSRPWFSEIRVQIKRPNCYSSVQLFFSHA